MAESKQNTEEPTRQILFRSRRFLQIFAGQKLLKTKLKSRI